MKVDVLLGLQWGDEGKGKIVDVLAPEYDVITRFQGGPNAGHSLEFNNTKHVLHTIPSGVFHPDIVNVIANGVVIDPVIFKKEIAALKALGVKPEDTLYISKRAHLIVPTHIILDKASEASKGKSKIGSTQKGIGPTYMDKTGRNGLRVGDIVADDFNQKYKYLEKKHKQLLTQYNYEYNLDEVRKEWLDSIEEIKRFKLIDSEQVLNDYLKKGKKILAEGAQGTLLDIDFGSYPYVTSSNTICAGACTGMGIAPNRIGEVFGIFKAYCTRVGSGPFPTELLDKTGEKLRSIGHEYGATTGRPRRCGWLDLPALKFSIMLNGVTQLIMTKADVLTGFKKIKICTHYKMGKSTIDYLPYDLDANLEPLYTDVKAWTKDITRVCCIEEMPVELMNYIKYIEEAVGVPITIISVGPDRKEIVFRK